MRRFLVVLVAMLVAGCAATAPIVNAPGKDDSDTIYSLSNVNPALSTYGGSSYAGQLYNSLSEEDAGRWQEQGFSNLVSVLANANACLGGTSAGLTMTPVACVAYNAGYRSTETGSITFSNNATTWVAMDENTSGNNAGLPNFTRVAGTHYLIDSIDVTQPTMAPDSQLLMKVVTSAGAITAVTDLRSVSIQTGLVTTAKGGTSCDSPTVFASLPVSAPVGTICTVSDANNCTAGTAVGSGGGAEKCQLTYTGSAWMPAGNAISAATGGFGTAGTGLTATGTTINLTTPVAIANGGTGSTSAGLTAGAGITVTGTWPTNTVALSSGGAGTVNSGNSGDIAYYASTGNAVSGAIVGTGLTLSAGTLDLAGPVTVANGGTQCGAPTTYSGLLGSPTTGQICTITDAPWCAPGQQITVGGGSSICTVVFRNSSWYPIGPQTVGALSITVQNDTTTGTVTHGLVKLTNTGFSSSTAAIETATTDTGGAIGICDSGGGTSGACTIVLGGAHSASPVGGGDTGVQCLFDNSPTQGDYVTISSSTAGWCHGAGATYPTSGQVIGRYIETLGSAAYIDLFPAEIRGAPLPASQIASLPSCSATIAGARAAVTDNDVACAMNGTPSHSTCTVGTNCYTCQLQCAETGSTSYAWTIY